MNDAHEACSASLPAYVSGSLTVPEEQQVREHIATCADCALELRAVEAMHATHVEEAPLTDLERARLHKAVTDDAFAVTTKSEPARGARLAPFLGAAALVAILGFFVTSVDLGGGGDEGGDAASSGGAESQDLSALLDLGGPPIASGRTERTAVAQGDSAVAAGTAGEALSSEVSDAAGEEGAAVEETGDDAGAPERPLPRFTLEGGAFNRKDVARFGRTQYPFTAFARSYSPAEVPELQSSYALALGSAGSSPAEREIIDTCAAQVLGQNIPILPAFGAYGRLGGRDALLLGFVFATGDTAPALDRYMIWVWPRSSCDAPLAAISGKVR